MTTPAEIAGKYRVLRLLGEGGMGQVFEAVNKNTERRVAIKTLHPHLSQDDLLVQRFLREARAATRVHHPNVVDVLDLDVDPATKAPYLVQEFLVGESLADALDARRERRFGVEEALSIIAPVLRALAAAHAVGVVHRDLKPDNIFLVRDAHGGVTPKVIDFGIAKVLEGQGEGIRMTHTGAVMGTPGYMSPEQAGGSADLDGRSDVWSIGVVLYELLVGRIPFDAPNYNLLVAKILYEEPTHILQVDPTLRRDVAAVVHRALTRARDARFPSIQAMLDATLACLGDAGTRETDVPAPPIAPPHAAPPTSTPYDLTLVPGSNGPIAPAPTSLATAPPASPTPPIPTLASWTGQRSPETRRSSALTFSAAAVVVAALAGSAWWFTRPPPPSTAASLRASVSASVTPVATVVRSTTAASPATTAAPDASTEAVAPSHALVAPTAVEATDASVETAPATSAPSAHARAAHARHHHARGATAHGDRDFDRGYPQ